MYDYPLIKFIIVFSCGILIQYFLRLDIVLLFISVSFLIFLLISLEIYTYVSKIWNNSSSLFQVHVITNTLLLLIIMLTGSLHFTIGNISKVEYPFEKGKLAGSIIYGEIKEIELLKKDYFNFFVESDSVLTEEYTGIQDAVYFCKLKRNSSKINSFFDSLAVGNKVKIEGVIRKGREMRNPYEFDYNAYLNSTGINALVYIKNIKDIKVADSAAADLFNFVYQIRKSLAESINELYNTEAAGLVKGLLLADKSGIDYSTREYFINAGVIHVLAVSGLHVGFIAYIFFILFNRFNIYLRYAATIMGLFAFVVLTGAPASVLRASIMAAILLITQLSNRSYNNFNTLALAAFILLVLNPNELFNPGFQLSFSAVFSILYFYPIFRNYMYKFENIPSIIQKLLLFFAVSLSAQLGTLPFTLTYFHKLSIIALFANLLVIPLIGFILSVAISSLFISVFSTWLAGIIAATNELAINILYRFVNYTGSLEFSFMYIQMFSIYDGIVFYIFLFGLFYGIKLLMSFRTRIIFSSLIILCFVIYTQIDNVNLLENGKLNIMMIDIGQGDSIFLQFPNGKNALIDGGDATPEFDNGMRVIIPLLRNLGVEKINYGIVSHMDADHYKGMVSLLESGMIDTIYKPIPDHDHENDAEFEEMLSDLDIPYFYHSEGSFNIGNVKIYSLTDSSSMIYKSFDVNNKSGIYKVLYGSTSFLFVGDAEKPAEILLCKSYRRFLDSDVLKVGHHGSKTSTISELLDYVDPEMALISAGLFNKFKHPSPVTIEKLERKNVEIHRTDLEGAVILQSDGKEISAVNWR